MESRKTKRGSYAARVYWRRHATFQAHTEQIFSLPIEIYAAQTRGLDSGSRLGAFDKLQRHQQYVRAIHT
jgi:hypothetical protein